MEKITFIIDGMRCGMCEAHVADAIRRALPSAKKVKASHGKGIATFLLEDNVDFNVAEQALEKRGYRVLNAQKEPAKKDFFLFG